MENAAPLPSATLADRKSGARAADCQQQHHRHYDHEQLSLHLYYAVLWACQVMTTPTQINMEVVSGEISVPRRDGEEESDDAGTLDEPVWTTIVSTRGAVTIT